MHRTMLLEQLLAYAHRWPQEADTVQRLRDFVAAHPDCFQRSQQAGHVTGSAWVVSADGERVLLTHHRKLDIWVQLGGHCDGEPNTLAVAQQEALEESGLAGLAVVPLPDSGGILDIDIHVIPARKGEPEHLHLDVRHALQATTDENYAVSAESHDLAWVPLADLAAYSQEPSLHRMASKWCQIQQNMG